MIAKGRRTEHGYFLFLAVIFILVIGIMGYTITYNFAARAKLIVAEHQGLQVFYMAESGAEIVTRLLTGTNLVSGQELTCDTVNGSTYVTNADIASGTFTATAIGGDLFTGSSTLAGAITSSSNSMTLASTAGFAPQGRVRIGSEAIDYASISGNVLLGLSRGASSTTPASHAVNTTATQSICLLNITAGIPSVNSPIYQRTLTVAIEILPDLSDIWAVGPRHGNRFTIIRWNQPTASVWNDYAFTNVSNREDLQAVSPSSDTNAWAVGLEKGNNFTMIRWNGSSWVAAPVGGACRGQDLMGVATNSTNEAFAVGLRYIPGCGSGTNYRYTVLKWNGSSWTLLTPSSVPSIPADAASNKSLNAISMLDTNEDGVADVGFAVGDSGIILQYTGSAWVASASGILTNLLGVSVVSNTEAWAVSSNGNIIKWNGSGWSSVASPTTQQLNAISMIDTDGDGVANAGWIVGNSGMILSYNGSSWVQQVSPDNIDLTGVVAVGVNTAWAVGKQDKLFKFNGSAWSEVSSPLVSDLSAIAMVKGTGAISGAGNPSGNWSQSS